MKFVSFGTPQDARFGFVTDRGVVDLTKRWGARCPDLLHLIKDKRLGEAQSLAGTTEADHALDAIHLRPVLPNPGKIICIGLNYEEHKKEGVRDPADKPMLFARWPETLIGHDEPLVIPKVSDKLDFEAELLVVIGTSTGRYCPAARALDHVFGYSAMNEGSVRDWQRHSSQVTAGKNFVGTGAVGPWLVTADEIGDPQDLDLELRLNGTVMQSANTRDMIWSVAEMIEYITQWIPLEPGDMLASGTPAGVGSRRTPPVFMQPGDVAEVSISRIGTLRNTVVKET